MTEQEIAEAIDSLDEVSKARLGSYIKGAVKSKESKSSDATGNRIFGATSKTDAAGQKYRDRADSLEKKAANRGKHINKAVDKLTKEETLNSREIIESVLNQQPVDFKSLVESILADKVDANLSHYAEMVAESALGYEVEEFEVTDENIEEILESLSDEELEELNAELASIAEDESLSEEELSEISKERVTKYVVKAAASLHKNRTAANDASSKAFKSAHNLEKVKNQGNARGETKTDWQGRMRTLKSRGEKAKADGNTASRNHKNRLTGIDHAGKRLAKD